MFLEELRLWNFRKFGSTGAMDLSRPDLTLSFQKGLNLLIGENDSGKTAIVDAIKLVLKTHSSEWIKIENEDFHRHTDRLRIECYFNGLEDNEAKNFTEWLGWNDTTKTPFLKVFLDVSRKDGKILPTDIKAGADDEGHVVAADAKEKIKVTYLRPLRDAVNELSSKRNSRLSQILYSHDAFKDKHSHRLINLARELNTEVAAYFKGKKGDGTDLGASELGGKALKSVMDIYLQQFSGKSTHFSMTDQDLKNILESLSLLFEDGYNLGLGSHNLLCIAAELLHLQKAGWDGLRLGLVEEIEAHLHPQVQMQVIETLQTEAETNHLQLIFTTHSPNIGSKIKLENLIICQNGKTFSMGSEYTKLEPTDYRFLQRFLDSTKANLFFARGVILVEGWAEELLLPVLARKIGHNLTEKAVSVVNIGNVAFLRYARIFQRKDPPEMDVKVAIITDVDVKPLLAGETKEIDDPAGGGGKVQVAYIPSEIAARIRDAINEKKTKYDGQSVKTYVSPEWTLEYCIAGSLKLRKLFYKSVLESLLEQKKDEGVKALTVYEKAITDIDLHFNNWTDPADAIAYRIYDHIINGHTELPVAKDEISKAIIAQVFAGNLQSNTSITDLHTETSLDYLFQAIAYATGN